MQRKVFITNRKGLKLATVVEAPNDDEKLPCVILLHGFKGYKEEETYTDLAERLVKKGISSVRFDASGFGESEGTLEEDYRFSNYINDTEDAYEWLKQQAFCDPDRIGVCGQSMGAVQTILFASQHPEIKAACAISPLNKVGTKDALGQVVGAWKQKGYLDEVSSKYGKIRIPYAYLEDVQQYDFVKLVKNVKCPLLIVAGKKDITVLPEQTMAVYKAAHQPKQLLEFDNMDHFYKRNPKVLAGIDEKVVAFLMENLQSTL